MYHFTALVTVLALMLYFYMAVRVSQARGKFGVKAPAMTGNADFERIFRVQMNTLEWMPIFLPALWLFAAYISDLIAALIGLVWIAGRAMYMVSYSQAAQKRGPGFGVQAAAASTLLISSLIAILWRMLHG